MDIIKILLIVHILGAAYMGLLIGGALFFIFKQKIQHYKPLALNIAISTCIQLISGSMMVLNQNGSESIISFCSKIGVYMLVVLSIESLLLKKLHETNQGQITRNLVASSLSLGMLFVLITILYL